MSQCAPVEREDDDRKSDEVAALERRIVELVAELHALLPPEHFRLVWELRDAEEALSYARELTRRRRRSAAP